MGKTALIAGATGLVGSYLLDRLLKDQEYTTVKVLSRKQLATHDKLDVVILKDFDKLNEVASQITADHVFCCLGTTMAKAKNKEAFKKVDYDYPLMLADISSKNNADKFLLISALGANKNSSVFYNEVKGEVEEELFKKKFQEIHVFRPSLLLGPRDEKRIGEDAAKKLYKVINFLFIGPLKKYQGIQASQVAKAMQYYAHSSTPGNHIHENKELLSI